MSRILMAGLPSELTSWLAHRLSGVAVQSTLDGQETLDELANGQCSLLIIDHGISGPPAADVVEIARHQLGMLTLPVMYCLEPGTASAKPEEMAQQLGLVQLLTHPLDREEIARLAANTLSLPQESPETGSVEDQESTFAALTGVWEHVRETVMGRLVVLEQAASSLLKGNLDNERRQEAEREAHNLSGLVGAFGYSEGTRLAQKLERLLKAGSPLGQAEAAKFSELAVSLRDELEQPMRLNMQAEPENKQEMP